MSLLLFGIYISQGRCGNMYFLGYTRAYLIICLPVSVMCLLSEWNKFCVNLTALRKADDVQVNLSKCCINVFVIHA